MSHLRADLKPLPFIAGFVALTLALRAAGTNSAAPAVSAIAGADTIFSNHLVALRQSAPAGFTVVEARPFVVLGDEPADVVHIRADKTVKWAVEKLKQDYFTRDPDEVIDVCT